MDQGRREQLRELTRTLQSIQQQVHDLWIEEERALENRSPPSKETVSAQTSSEAVHHLEEATQDLQTAIEAVVGFEERGLMTERS